MASQESCGGYYGRERSVCWMKKNKSAPIRDRASVTEMLDQASISCLALSNKKEQREDSTACGRQNVAA